MNHQIHWVVQSNLGNTQDIATIEQACAELGLACTLVKAIPFSTELPDIPSTQPTIFYGSTNFVTNAHRSKQWQPCAFFDEDLFRFSVVHQHYGDAVINTDAVLTTMEAFVQRDYPSTQEFFIRPDNDLKAFGGSLFTFGAFQEWVTKLAQGDFELGLNTPIIMAKPKVLEHEWRLFIVDGKVISGSHYRSYGDLVVLPEVPQKVIQFAEQLAQKWSPAPIFVMDIAQCKGKLGVLEINGFNSSGFYASDIKAIIKAVSDYVANEAK